MSVDPLSAEYPWFSPYQFSGNKPSWAIDLDGLEENYTNTGVRVIGPVATFGGDVLYNTEELQANGITPNGVTFNYNQEKQYLAWKEEQKANQASSSAAPFGFNRTSTAPIVQQSNSSGVDPRIVPSTASFIAATCEFSATTVNKNCVVRGTGTNARILPRDFRGETTWVGGDGPMGPVSSNGGNNAGRTFQRIGYAIEGAVLLYDGISYIVAEPGSNAEMQAEANLQVDAYGVAVGAVCPPLGMAFYMAGLAYGTPDYWQCQRSNANFALDQLGSRFWRQDGTFDSVSYFNSEEYLYWSEKLNEAEFHLNVNQEPNNAQVGPPQR